MLFLALLTFCCTTRVQAQKLKVVDSDGNAVSYASVLNPDAEYIGITDLDGIVPDLGGARDITITHVAFKTKRVKLSGSDATVALEDADFAMPEIVVEPKPYVYVQTYYRLYYYSSKDGIVYYRAGLTDNVYDSVKKKMTYNTRHTAKAKYGLLKTVLGMFGDVFDRQSHISANKVEPRLKKWAQPLQLTFTPMADGKQSISDGREIVGYVTDDLVNHQRRYAYNSSTVVNHRLEASGDTKKLAKREKRHKNRKNEEDVDYHIYHIDNEGNYAPEDYVMSQHMSSWDELKDSVNEHEIIALQSFAIERAYVTKKDLKERKKANKMKMTYANILQFERDHNIPALAPVVQKKLNELWKSGE